MHMVLHVLSAPVALHQLGVLQTIAGGAAHVGHEHREAVEGKELDDGHREPAEIGAFLPLRPAVYVEDHRALVPVKPSSAEGI